MDGLLKISDVRRLPDDERFTMKISMIERRTAALATTDDDEDDVDTIDFVFYFIFCCIGIYSYTIVL